MDYWESSRQKVKKSWSKEETMALLEFYKARQTEFQHSRKKKFAYAHVLEDMISAGLTGPNTTAVHLAIRMATLLRAYKAHKVAKENSHRTVCFKSVIPFVKQIDEIYESTKRSISKPSKISLIKVGIKEDTEPIKASNVANDNKPSENNAPALTNTHQTTDENLQNGGNIKKHSLKTIIPAVSDGIKKFKDKIQDQNEFEPIKISNVTSDNKPSENIAPVITETHRTTDVNLRNGGNIKKHSLKTIIPAFSDEIKKFTDSTDDRIQDTNNEFEVFCKSLAIQLKNMPLHRAVVCQAKLQYVMTRERLFQLGQSHSIISSSSCSKQQLPLNDDSTLSSTGTESDGISSSNKPDSNEENQFQVIPDIKTETELIIYDIRTDEDF